MSFNKAQSALVALAVAILISGVLYLRSQAGSKEGQSYANVTLVGKLGERVVLSYDELSEVPSVSGNVSFQNRLGNWGAAENLKGPKISDLVERVGGMVQGDILRVSSTDGYEQEFSYYNVYPDEDWISMQGELIIAFSMDEKEIPDWVEGPRTAFLPPDNEFSNDDCRYTSSLGQGYFLNPSAGARFVRYAWMIEVLGFREQDEEWVVSLEGSSKKNLSRTEFEAMAHGNRVNLTDGQGTSWSGMPLWALLGLVDGAPARGNESYDVNYADSGYEVKLAGEVSLSLPSSEVSHNSSILVADTMDGTALLNGPALVTRDSNIRALSSISIHTWWVLKVEGAESSEIPYSEITGLEDVQSVAGYMKSTGTVVGPVTIRGVPLLTIAELAGELPGDYSLEVTAADGYSIMLSKDEAEGNVPVYDSEGGQVSLGGVTAVLYFEEEGSKDFDGKPLRLGFVGDDGPITDGHYWIKEVDQITIRQPVVDWNLELQGLSEYVLNRTSFESAATCKNHRVVINQTSKDGVHSYQGLPLWVVVSIVDGKQDPEGHYFFNDDLAREGYEVRIIAADGYSATINSTLLWRNDKIILGFLKDDEVLPPDEWPLKVVGEGLSGQQMVKQVIRLELIAEEEK